MAEPSGTLPGETPAPASDRRPRVLVVDDAIFMRMMLKDLLTKSGLEVVGQAANGDEAVDVYRKMRPDVVTLDIMMPHSDGLGALEAILREDPQARIVVVSAIEQNETVQRALDLGAADYLLKPFSPHRIVEVLKRVTGDETIDVEVNEELE